MKGLKTLFLKEQYRLEDIITKARTRLESAPEYGDIYEKEESI